MRDDTAAYNNLTLFSHHKCGNVLNERKAFSCTLAANRALNLTYMRRRGTHAKSLLFFIIKKVDNVPANYVGHNVFDVNLSMAMIVSVCFILKKIE